MSNCCFSAHKTLSDFVLPLNRGKSVRSLLIWILNKFYWSTVNILVLWCGHFPFYVHVIVEFSKEDMAKSLLHMISNDIGQLACLYAKLHNLSRVYFGGFFIRGHPVTMHTITYSINFFTKARPRPPLQTEIFLMWSRFSHWDCVAVQLP